jgi:glycosyltransferase involved in cell wall biosynthesis
VRIVYVLLSPTFGMHQYTADLANRFACGHGAGYLEPALDEALLVTTAGYPADRYSPAVEVHTLLHTTGTGFSAEGLRVSSIGRIAGDIIALQPDVVHFTGPHLWNVPLVRMLRAYRIPTIHTVHDVEPHDGARFGVLLPVWNNLIIRSADHILVHGEHARSRLLQRGLPPPKVSCTPLLHLFLSYEQECALAGIAGERAVTGSAGEPSILFFGRLEAYKGIDVLLTAYAQLVSYAESPEAGPVGPVPKLVMAGRGGVGAFWAGKLPDGVVLHGGLIGDREALELFRGCSLVVLPYTDATQSALVAAAYFFHKPVIVTRAGALPEYVEDQVTGFVVEPGHPASLARALATAMTDPGRLRQMGDAGRAWYERHRPAETATLVRLYRRVAQRRRSASMRYAGEKAIS